MTDENVKLLINNLPAIIGSIAALVAAVASVISAMRSGKNAKTLETVRTDINGKMAEHLELQAKASRAEGVLEERVRQTAGNIEIPPESIVKVKLVDGETDKKE